MTRSTQQVLLSIAALTLSLGFVGWLAWKVGALDVVLAIVINTAMLFPIFFVAMGVLNPDTYNLFADKMNETVQAINAKFKAIKAKNTDNTPANK